MTANHVYWWILRIRLWTNSLSNAIHERPCQSPNSYDAGTLRNSLPEQTVHHWRSALLRNLPLCGNYKVGEFFRGAVCVPCQYMKKTLGLWCLASLNDYSIRYENTRTHAGRMIALTLVSEKAWQLWRLKTKRESRHGCHVEVEVRYRKCEEYIPLRQQGTVITNCPTKWCPQRNG